MISKPTGLNWCLIAVVKAYRLLLSPWMGSACRFAPTCSEYAMRALQTHGAVAGVYLTASRIARCHPWCAGGEDPVPTILTWPRASSLLARLRSRWAERVQPNRSP